MNWLNIHEFGPTTSAVEPEGEFFSFMKRRRTDTADAGEEYTK
jgi:hypothetical protein